MVSEVIPTDFRNDGRILKELAGDSPEGVPLLRLVLSFVASLQTFFGLPSIWSPHRLSL